MLALCKFKPLKKVVFCAYQQQSAFFVPPLEVRSSLNLVRSTGPLAAGRPDL